MANFNSVIKTAGRASRKEAIQKNPIPWVVLIVSVIIAGGFFIYPDAKDWMSKREAITEMEREIPSLETENQALTLEKQNLEETFTQKASVYISAAEQRLPDTIDATKIAQILEMYSILMKVNYRANTLNLTSLTISAPNNVDGANYAESLASISLSADREMLEEFMSFLKSSTITDELRRKVVNSGGGENASLDFLAQQKLPMARINSLSMNEDNGPEDEEPTYNVQIQAYFHSKPL